MNIAGQRRPACVTRLNCEFRGALVTVNRRWPPSVCFLQHTSTRQGSGTAHPAARLARRWDRDPQLRFNGGQCRRRRRPICRGHRGGFPVLRTSDRGESRLVFPFANGSLYDETEEHTSELQSPFLISYAVFCLKKKKTTTISCTKNRCALLNACSYNYICLPVVS